MTHLKNFSTIYAELVIDELIKCGITQFYISPGKRNLPLVNALTRQSKASFDVCIDERSAAFIALGYIQKSLHPAALICTSGSALAHYSPAVIEARTSKRPLLIISADRPIELVHGHANQSTIQDNFYNLDKDHYYNFGANSEDLLPQSIKRRVCHLSHILDKENTPVHLNIPFNEPLDYSKQKISSSYITLVESLLNNNRPYTIYQEEGLDELRSLLSKSSTAVVVGAYNNSFNLKNLSQFLKSISVELFCDITSIQSHRYSSFHPDTESFEMKLAKKKIKQIIHIGGRLTSNKYYTLMSKYNIPIIQVTPLYQRLEDPSFQVKKILQTSKLPVIIPTKRKKSRSLHNLSGPSHYKVAKELWENLPEKENLLIANSMIIRAFDIITKKTMRSNLFFQRGASGIDGNISHAIGIAQASKVKTNLIIGDIAFLHDIGVLQYLSQNKPNLTIYIINNSQGGIFNLLELKGSKEAQKVIATKHSQKIESIVKSFQLGYFKAVTLEELQKINLKIINQTGTSIVEIIVSQKVSEQHFNKITSA